MNISELKGGDCVVTERGTGFVVRVGWFKGMISYGKYVALDGQRYVKLGDLSFIKVIND